ncbi:CsbD family protein [Nocardioides sp. Y6]|uniref:CsbD family protein n=1 Tax=Nocardioides malaquae TaxID=2773426 RepID=A0ABR9RT11_9ACTN|nr:CsbD family protein [Nocardioides malaquae]MBE7324302.1 CsbD family protein [Nocardioides malaquae]
MGFDDKAKHKVEDMVGRGKEATGAATDDDSLRAEGKADQTKAGVKDKVTDIKDKVNDKIDDIGS